MDGFSSRSLGSNSMPSMSGSPRSSIARSTVCSLNTRRAASPLSAVCTAWPDSASPRSRLLAMRRLSSMMSRCMTSWYQTAAATGKQVRAGGATTPHRHPAVRAGIRALFCEKRPVLQTSYGQAGSVESDTFWMLMAYAGQTSKQTLQRMHSSWLIQIILMSRGVSAMSHETTRPSSSRWISLS